MKVLVVGAGGREHALVCKLAESELVEKIYCAPGNPGIASLADLVNIAVSEVDDLLAFAKENQINLTIVGPELPLTLGIVDKFEAAGLKVFGPTRRAAELEASKDFCKEIMVAAGVPTAAYQTFTNINEAKSYLSTCTFPQVLKADGLAAGKGVVICHNLQAAEEALGFIFKDLSSHKIIIEQFLAGVEASLIVATDGTRVVPLCTSNDYKTIFEGNTGPNTGGMGTVSPTKHLSLELEKRALTEVIEPVLAELRKRGIIFKGFLYAGLMIAEDQQLNVLEFNVRCGDPETQVIMARMQGDLAELLLALSSSAENKIPNITWSSEAAVCFVLAAPGYPLSTKTGQHILKIAEAEKLFGVQVLHAGTALDDAGNLRAAGGRVLNIISKAQDLESARSKAVKAAELIQFDGKQFRRDIGLSYQEIRAQSANS